MIRNLFAPTDMTVGSPWKSIVSFTLPMLIGNIAQQLYSTVDSIVVGKYIGDNALAAVGSAMPIVNMLLVLFIGISAGASIMVSQYCGAKNRNSLSHTIGNCITVTAIASIGLIVFASPFIRPVLAALNTPKSIIDDCGDYLLISLVPSILPYQQASLCDQIPLVLPFKGLFHSCGHYLSKDCIYFLTYTCVLC